MEIFFPQKIKSSENQTGETHSSISKIFRPQKGVQKVLKNKNKTPCGPTSSNNLVCVACKFVQVEEEKEAF